VDFRTLGRWVPGPAILLFGQWLGLFSETHLTYPDWEDGASKIALGLSAFIAAVLLALLDGTSKPKLRRVTWLLFALTLIGFAVCWVFWHMLGEPMPQAKARVLQASWEVAYVITMLLLVSTITTGVMSRRVEKPANRLLVVVIVVLVVLLLLAIVFEIVR
jgi:predicted membrane channel-forming protein YqfA (hemolysin III family)